jgi:bifunctional non-homologous end joining protein LigD
VPLDCERASADGAFLREHLEGEHGEAMFRHACTLGLEGIISKRLDKPYSSGPCQHWRKVKNPVYERRGSRSVLDD